MLLTLPWLFEIANFISRVRLEKCFITDGNTSQFGTAVEQLFWVVFYFVEVPLENAFGLLVPTLCPTSLMCSRKYPYPPSRSFQVEPPTRSPHPSRYFPSNVLSLQ